MLWHYWHEIMSRLDPFMKHDLELCQGFRGSKFTHLFASYSRLPCDILFGIPAPSTTNRDVRLASRRVVLVCHRDFRLGIATWIIRRNMRCLPRWHPEIFLSSCILFAQLLSSRRSWFINSKLCVNCNDTKQQRAKKFSRENYFRFARV